MAECADTRVLLMDADVDAPAQHTLLRLNVPRGSGFSEQLDRFARDGVVGSVTVLRVTESLQALVESRWGTPGLLDSPAFTRVLAQQQLEQDVIVIDGPVLDAWADAKMLHGIGDVIFVISAGTDAQEANRAINAHFERERVLAVLFTGG
jgi:Mrp family chromosome partitioning ATPase